LTLFRFQFGKTSVFVIFRAVRLYLFGLLRQFLTFPSFVAALRQLSGSVFSFYLQPFLFTFPFYLSFLPFPATLSASLCACFFSRESVFSAPVSDCFFSLAQKKQSLTGAEKNRR
jgi:hypothetical protein